MASRRILYSTEQARENKRKARFDPLHPAFIRQDVDDEDADEFEDDVGLSRQNVKRKQVRVDVCP
jgi:hypothetical protein